jgi:hypothetical protein
LLYKGLVFKKVISQSYTIFTDLDLSEKFRILGVLKNTFAIICLFTLLLSTSSISYYYWVEEKLHEKETFALIDAGELENGFANLSSHQIKLILKDKVSLPEGYIWEEKGREFSHEGTFYDIISLEKSLEGWVLVAASDEEESEMVAKQSDHSKNQTFKLSKKQLTFIAPEHYLQKTISNKVQVEYAHFKVTLDQISIFQNSPPPERI